MTSSSSTSIFSFMLMAVVCNMMMTSTGLPTKVDDAQSKQIFFAPQYNYPNYVPANFYNPYAKAIVNPAAVDPNENPNLHYVYAPSSLGDFALETADFNRGSRETIIISPANTECLTSGTNTNGGGTCKAGSQERSGTIDITLGVAAQSANVAITAPSANTRIRLVCTEMIAATAFTQTGKINAPSDTPRFENGFLNLVVVSTGANARAKCSWRI